MSKYIENENFGMVNRMKHLGKETFGQALEYLKQKVEILCASITMTLLCLHTFIPLRSRIENGFSHLMSIGITTSDSTKSALVKLTHFQASNIPQIHFIK